MTEQPCMTLRSLSTFQSRFLATNPGGAGESEKAAFRGLPFFGFRHFDEILLSFVTEIWYLRLV